MSKNGKRCSEGNTILPRIKNYTFTSFGEKPKFNEEIFRYMGYGKEKCPKTGKKHWQGMCIFNKKRSFKSAKKLLQKYCGNKCHVEMMRSTINKNLKYCKKEGKYKEYGTLPKPGERNDLNKLKEEILNGKTVKEIAMENLNYYHQYGRSLNYVEDIRLSENERTEPPKCIWYWGKTGVGKSHKAYENTTVLNRYTWNKLDKWWDKYYQQDYVIINDFRGEIEYSVLLEMLDKWPFYVPRRCREPIPFNSKYIIITAPNPPENTYRRQLNKNDGIDQLLRRIEVIELTKKQ